MHRSQKKGAPKHQNKKAFYHNPGSKKTAAIAQISHSGLCKRCNKIIAWKKQYRKYKPLKAPKKCADCHLRKIRRNYHTVCDDCAIKRGGVCAKCLLTEEQSQAQLDAENGVKKTAAVASGSVVSQDSSMNLVEDRMETEAGAEGKGRMKEDGGREEAGSANTGDDEAEEEEDEEDEEEEDERLVAKRKFGTTGNGINCGGLERWMESVVPDELRSSTCGNIGNAVAAAAAAAAAKEAREKRKKQLADDVAEESFLAQEKAAAANLSSLLALKKKRKAVHKKQRRKR